MELAQGHAGKASRSWPPHVPASLTKLEQAVKRAHAAYDKAETAAREQQRAERQAVDSEVEDGTGDKLDEDLDSA